MMCCANEIEIIIYYFRYNCILRLLHSKLMSLFENSTNNHTLTNAINQCHKPHNVFINRKLPVIYC